MTALEFIKKYCGNNLLRYHQRTIDLMESVEETLTIDDGLALDVRKGACHYRIEVELEVMDKELPDYKFLQEALADLELITE